MARLLERAGVDVLLVGDSVATAVLGYDTTLPVTLDVMIHHTAAVVRGTERALVIADMPFLTYQITPSEAVRNAGRLLKDAGAAAVKVEGGQSVHRRCTQARRCGHPGDGASRCIAAVGESAERVPAARTRSRTKPSSSSTMRSRCRMPARLPSCSRRFRSELAARITAALDVPTIGIGAGPDCDGQVLVSSDLLGLHDKVPPFAKKYANLADIIVNAARAFVADVQATALRRRSSAARELGRDQAVAPAEASARDH